MKKLLSISALVLGIFVVSSFGQETNPNEKPKNNQNQGQKQKRNGGKGGEKGNKKFQEIDKNGDGFISKEEWNRNEKAFNRVDTNADGRLSKEELAAAKQQKDNNNKPKPTNTEV